MPELQESQGLRVAIEGCGHGVLHSIYASVTQACHEKGWPGVDLLIIGGDFQVSRSLQSCEIPSNTRSRSAMPQT